MGIRLGRYRIIAQLGQGAMGTVYHGVDDALQKNVAIKVLRSPLMNDDDLVARFTAEVATVNQIAHPNIVNIFDLNKLPDGRPYYVMEHLRGVSLEQWLGSTVHVQTLLPWMRFVAEALEAGHARRIVHRDLKPDNIFLVETGPDRYRAKVLDYGVAKLLEQPTLTRTGSQIGTPLYMPPESFTGGSIDQRVDIYAFGAIYYRALTRRFPSPTDSLARIASFHISGELPIKPSVLGAPQAFDEPILRCLANDPNRRFNSIIDAQSAFERAFEAANSSAQQLPVHQRSAVSPIVSHVAPRPLYTRPPSNPFRPVDPGRLEI